MEPIVKAFKEWIDRPRTRRRFFKSFGRFFSGLWVVSVYKYSEQQIDDWCDDDDVSIYVIILDSNIHEPCKSLMSIKDACDEIEYIQETYDYVWLELRDKHSWRIYWSDYKKPREEFGIDYKFQLYYGRDEDLYEYNKFNLDRFEWND